MITLENMNKDQRHKFYIHRKISNENIILLNLLTWNLVLEFIYFTCGLVCIYLGW